MASVRTVLLLLLLPPVSVLLCMAVRWLCRVAARKLTALARAQLACPPSSFRYLLSVEKEEAIVRGLPVALYRRSGGGDSESSVKEEECVLCLSGIEEGEEVRELKCRHLFHRGCLDRWLLARPLQATCPLCRCRLLAPSPWEPVQLEVDYYGYGYGYGYDGEGREEEEEDSDMTMFMACVHSRSSWLWPS